MVYYFRVSVTKASTAQTKTKLYGTASSTSRLGYGRKLTLAHFNNNIALIISKDERLVFLPYGVAVVG